MRLWTQGIQRNKDQVEKSAKLSEEAALELGAEIVANSVTFGIGLLAIIMQQSIVSATEKKREKLQDEESRKVELGILELQSTVFEMGLRLETMDAQLRQMNRTIMSMEAYNKISSKDLNKVLSTNEDPPF